MNAPIMNTHASPGHALTPLALQNETLLRAIAAINTPAEGPPTTIMDLASATNRDDSNVGKSLKALTAEGLVTREPRIALTMAGGGVLAALDRAAGHLPTIALDATDAEDRPDVVYLAADRLAPDPANPRRRSGLTQASIDDMAASIRERVAAGLPGLITPPTVRPPVSAEAPWRINMGERRWRGWTLAVSRGWIAANVAFPCPVFRGDDAAALDGAVVENVQREDLDDLELGEVFLAYDRLGLAVADICRRIGKTSPDPVRQASYERWVQERLKVAREADPRAKDGYIASRAAEAAGLREAEPFTWTMLRDSVKTPRHVTVLERNPRLRLMLLEMAWLSSVDGAPWDADMPIAPHAPGGLMDLAEELGLADYDRAQGQAHLTGRACAWLAEQGFDQGEPDDDLAMLSAVRADALGMIGAAALAEGMAGTDFLNLPTTPAPAEPGSDASPLPPPLSPLAGGESVAEGEALPLSATEPSPDDDTTEIPAFLRRLAGGGEPLPEGEVAGQRPAGEGATAPEHSATAPSAPTPTPAQQLVLVEAAWRIAHAGEETRGGALRGATAHDFHLDPLAAAMIPRWLGFVQNARGDHFLVTLTTTAWEWLNGYYEGGVAAKDVDAVRFNIAALPIDQIDRLRQADRCVTAWLNPPAPAEAAAARVEADDTLPQTPPAQAGDDAPPDPGATDGAAAENAAPSPNLDPVVLMRRALTDLWLAAGDHYAAAQAVLAATGDAEQAALEDDALAAAALTLQRALAAAATFVPAQVKAERETPAHD